MPNRPPPSYADGPADESLVARLVLAATTPENWVLVFVATLPLMMVSHIAVNHFVEPWLGLATPLVYPEVLVALILIAMPGRGGIRVDDSLRRLVVVSLALGVWLAFCSVVQQAPVRYWPRRLAIEWLLGPLIGVGFARHMDARVWRRVRETWMWTSLAGVLVALCLYVVSVGIPTSFRELVFDNRTYYLQFGLARGVYFGELTFGGVNDIASYYGIVYLVYLAMLLDGEEHHRWRMALLPSVLVLEYLCYSRGVLLGLAMGTGFLVACRVAKAAPWGSSAKAALAACALFWAAVVAPPDAWAYWRGQLTIEESSTAALRMRMWSGSLDAEHSAPQATRNLPPEIVTGMRSQSEGRAQHRRTPSGVRGTLPAGREQREADRELERDPETEARQKRVSEAVGGGVRRFLVGYGTGNYGLLAGATPDFGVHNLFLEAFVAGGALGLALFIVLWAGFVWRAYGWAVAGGGATAWSALAVAGFLTFVGAFVSVRFENLGTYVLGTIFWLIAAGPYGTTAAKLSAPAAQDTPSASL